MLVLLRALRKERPSWTLQVISGDDGPLTEAVRKLGCRVSVLPYPARLKQLGDWGAGGRVRLAYRLACAMPGVLSYAGRLRKMLRDFAPDAVQTNGFKMHILGALACPACAKLIWHIHDFVQSRPAMRLLLRCYSGRANAIVAISPAVADDVRGIVRHRERVLTILNAIDLGRFSPCKKAEAGAVRIGLIATFARWKGHEVFLRALALLPRRLEWQAIVAGGAVYRTAGSQYSEQELRKLAASLGIGARVEFTGFLADPAPLLRSLDIAVHASTEPEPFGLAIAEAMAAGKAVVASSADMIDPGVNGLLHERGDTAGLHRALEQLANDPGLRERLGANARETAERLFRPERLAEEFLSLYGAL